jgi:hypothetical protein
MKYMLLIQYGDHPSPAVRGVESPFARRAEGGFRRLPGGQRDAWCNPGERLQHPREATTLRVQDGNTLTTDGPFVSVKEGLGGYPFFEADDLDAAIELASRIPAARMGGSVEVRPIKEQ